MGVIKRIILALLYALFACSLLLTIVAIVMIFSPGGQGQAYLIAFILTGFFGGFTVATFVLARVLHKSIKKK